VSIRGWCFDRSENRLWYQTLEKSNSCGNMVLYCNKSFSFEVECKGYHGFRRSSPSSGEVECLIGDALREGVEEDGDRSVALLRSNLILVNSLDPPSRNLSFEKCLDYCC